MAELTRGATGKRGFVATLSGNGLDADFAIRQVARATEPGTQVDRPPAVTTASVVARDWRRAPSPQYRIATVAARASGDSSFDQ